MPMLPSGRHVNVIRDSLSELLDNAEQSTNVHKVLAIQVTADIYPYTDLVWLLPASQASQEQIDAAFLDGSLPRPQGLVPVKSGYRLSQFAEFAVDWSDDDKAAFWEFINVRAAHLFAASLELTVKVQSFLRMASARLRIVLDQQSPAVRPGRRVRGSCGAGPQRPPASPLHNAVLPAVPTIRCAEAPLGAGHRLAPCRVKATGVMQSGLRRSRSHSPRSLVRLTRRRLRGFVVVLAPSHSVA